MEVKLIHVTHDPVNVIEQAASKCYNSTPSPDGKIMKACYESGHESVLEHCAFTFEINGVSRALLAQLTRHRIASFTVRSQRYCNEQDFEYVLPQSLQKEENIAAKIEFIKAMDYINKVYQTLQNDFHISPEDARYVLPNACCTQLVMTMNLRSLLNFMHQRLCKRAQWEIRQLAQAMKQAIISQYPQFEYMLVPKCEVHAPYSFCLEKKSCKKHPKLSEVYRKNDKRNSH